MEFDLVPRKELLYNIFGPISMSAGIASEILVLLFPNEPETWFFESCFGNIPDVEKSEYSFYGHMSTSITVEEAV
jgi:hypothetical protein